MNKLLKPAVFLLLAILPVSLAAQEEVLRYPVRLELGQATYTGALTFTTTQMFFKGDQGKNINLPYLHIDYIETTEVGGGIIVYTNRETGLSFGDNDKFKFFVVGDRPDPDAVAHINVLVNEAKKQRVETARAMPGEIARYMVSKGEVVGDDVGLLIITEDRIFYYSDTGGKEHNWSYAELNGIQISTKESISIHTDEGSILKLGAHRVYDFISQTGPYSKEALQHIIGKIYETRKE